MSRSALQGIVPRIADVDQVIMRLGDIEEVVKVSSDGMVSVSASLKAASEEDADKIRALAKVGLMEVRSQWSENPYMPREFVKKLDAVKIGGTDGEIKVQNVDPLGAFVPAYMNHVKESRIETTRMLIANVELALKSYNFKHGKYPDSLEALTQAPDEDSDPLLEGEPVDPWGNELHYQKQGKKRPKITSFGPDGEEGGGDDITNYDERKMKQ